MLSTLGGLNALAIRNRPVAAAAVLFMPVNDKLTGEEVEWRVPAACGIATSA
jgi:hypothetical protein